MHLHARRMLHVACRMSHVACRMLTYAHRSARACCMLHVACRMSHVAWCMSLSGTCCVYVCMRARTCKHARATYSVRKHSTETALAHVGVSKRHAACLHVCMVAR